MRLRMKRRRRRGRRRRRRRRRRRTRRRSTIHIFRAPDFLLITSHVPPLIIAQES